MKNILPIIILSFVLSSCVPTSENTSTAPVGNFFLDQMIPLIVGNKWVYVDEDGSEISYEMPERRTFSIYDQYDPGKEIGKKNVFMMDGPSDVYFGKAYEPTREGINYYTFIYSRLSPDTLIPKYPNYSQAGTSTYLSTWFHAYDVKTPAGTFGKEGDMNDQVILNNIPESDSYMNNRPGYNIYYVRNLGIIKLERYKNNDTTTYLLKSFTRGKG